MQAQHTHSGILYSAGCEFFPPVDEAGVAETPWDMQLKAALDWQEAGANSDGTSCQWEDPPRLWHVGQAKLSMQTVVRVNTLNVALRERLLQITSEMSNIAIAEMGLRKDEPAEGGGEAAAKPSATPEMLDEANALKLMALTRAWFEVMAMAQASMSTLTGYSPRATGDASGMQTPYAASPLVERRQRVMHIDFADRRKVG